MQQSAPKRAASKQATGNQDQAEVLRLERSRGGGGAIGEVVSDSYGAVFADEKVYAEESRQRQVR
jgi:hypothetical protein